MHRNKAHIARSATLIALLSILWIRPTSAIEVVTPLFPFSLVEHSTEANEIGLEITIAVFGTQRQTAVVSGDLTGNLRLNVEGDQVEITGLEFTPQGRASVSDTLFHFSNLLGFIDASAVDLQATIDTVPSFGTVSNGQFSTLDHSITIDTGTVSINGQVAFVGTISETYDFGANPFSLTSDQTGSIDLFSEGQSNGMAHFRTRISIPVDQSQDIPDLPVAVRLGAVGTIVAEGYFSIDVGLPGDYNGDGHVDTADYTVWRDTLGATGAGLAADGDNDNDVDGQDYAVWRAEFGSATSAGSFVAGRVPEPSSALLLLGGGLVAVLVARCGQQPVEEPAPVLRCFTICTRCDLSL